MSGYAKTYWLHAITPLHVGAGQGLGFIDLPIVREKTTNWPLVAGSTIKGVWRDYFQINKPEDFTTIFGKEGQDVSRAGSVVISDARIVFMPVRSLYGTFAYVTTPLVLDRIARDIALTLDKKIQSLSVSESNQGLTTKNSVLSDTGKVYLEDLDIDSTDDETVEDLAKFFSKVLFPKDNEWQEIFCQRMLVVSEPVFNYLSVHSTDVVARTRIDSQTGVVAPGQLWYEENLPPEAILGGLLWSDKVIGDQLTPKELLERNFSGEFLCQLGGNETVGNGRVRCIFHGGKEV